ncbi:MAG: GNAT family N-acetyltransferase [Butyricicoccus sp.]|nr:GNAT family N-acetyltransferase [Butyricicoccus sp.]MBQ8585991.1 GNAT family N-acetyltransferase [Butyricicoccus sp.]
MLTPLSFSSHADFETACGYEQVFGSKILTAYTAYGLADPNHRFWIAFDGEKPTGALYLNGKVLIISSKPYINADEVAALVQEHGITEVDSSWALCEKLHAKLGGVTESSYYMVYRGGPIEETFDDIAPADLNEVFSVLQQSHEYYRTHLKFEPWANDLTRRMKCGFTEVYQLTADGKVVGTGSIISQDKTCGAIAAVAVIPEYRHRGLGSRMSRFLVQRISALGKTPRLISGYDAVAELYLKIGFAPCGRWGELYL